VLAAYLSRICRVFVAYLSRICRAFVAHLSRICRAFPAFPAFPVKQKEQAVSLLFFKKKSPDQ